MYEFCIDRLCNESSVRLVPFSDKMIENARMKETAFLNVLFLLISLTLIYFKMKSLVFVCLLFSLWEIGVLTVCVRMCRLHVHVCVILSVSPSVRECVNAFSWGYLLCLHVLMCVLNMALRDADTSVVVLRSLNVCVHELLSVRGCAWGVCVCARVCARVCVCVLLAPLVSLHDSRYNDGVLLCAAAWPCVCVYVCVCVCVCVRVAKTQTQSWRVLGLIDACFDRSCCTMHSVPFQ